MKKILSLALAIGTGFGSLINCNMNNNISNLNNYEQKTSSYWDEECKEITNNYWNGDSSSFCICKNITRNEKYYTLLHINGKGHIFILDGGFGGKLDGLTDYLHINDGESDLTLVRIKHYPEFKKQFDEADKFLEEKVKEFKKYLN